MGKKNVKNNNGSKYIPDKKSVAAPVSTMGSTSLENKVVKKNDSDKDNGENKTEGKVGINKMKSKKNENVKNKMVYFNITNKNEELILKWSSQGVTSFSSRVKQMLYEEMMNDEDFLRREGLRL